VLLVLLELLVLLALKVLKDHQVLLVDKELKE
jgi:hypothetical protein